MRFISLAQSLIIIINLTPLLSLVLTAPAPAPSYSLWNGSSLQAITDSFDEFVAEGIARTRASTPEAEPYFVRLINIGDADPPNLDATIEFYSGEADRVRIEYVKQRWGETRPYGRRSRTEEPPFDWEAKPMTSGEAVELVRRDGRVESQDFDFGYVWVKRAGVNEPFDRNLLCYKFMKVIGRKYLQVWVEMESRRVHVSHDNGIDPSTSRVNFVEIA